MITSTANPRVQALLALRETRERRRQGLCLIEGQAEIRLAFDAGVRIQELFYTDGPASSPAPIVPSMARAGR